MDSLTNGMGSENLPAQWINCDLRYLDFRVLGKFDVLMCDPPWDIHMQVIKGLEEILYNLLIASIWNIERQ